MIMGKTKTVPIESERYEKYKKKLIKQDFQRRIRAVKTFFRKRWYLATKPFRDYYNFLNSKPPVLTEKERYPMGIKAHIDDKGYFKYNKTHIERYTTTLYSDAENASIIEQWEHAKESHAHFANEREKEREKDVEDDDTIEVKEVVDTINSMKDGTIDTSMKREAEAKEEDIKEATDNVYSWNKKPKDDKPKRPKGKKPWER